MDILVLNIGSFGLGEFTTTETRLNLIKLMFAINEKYAKFPDVVCCQEAVCFLFSLAPRFGKPSCISDNTRIGTIENGVFLNRARGVVTYCDAWINVNSLKNHDKFLEIVVSIHEYNEDTAKGKVIKKLVLFNCYRNIHETAKSASLERMIEFIERKIKEARIMGIRDAVIVGDFNDETVEFKDMTEVFHESLIHKHNRFCEPKRIDKCFTNIKNLYIQEVFRPCENKIQNDDVWLGHRPYLIKLGNQKTPPSEFKITDSEQVQLQSSEWKYIAEFNNKYSANETGLDSMVKDLISKSVEIVEKSSKVITRKVKSGDEMALELMNSYTMSDLKKPIPAKMFYRFMDLFRSGTGQTTCSDQPELKCFVSFANGKLSRLNRPDFSLLKQVCFDLWGGRTKTVFNFPDPDEFRKAILSTSNSNAKDVYGISLKVGKMIMRNSTGAFQLLYGITKLSAYLGIIHREFKIDLITMLFKNKGERLLPEFWRPITIAVSFGKMISKVMLLKYNQVTDGHTENHAYAPKKSCMSAIATVLEEIRKIISTSKLLAIDGWELIPVIFLEDIKAAFESIIHQIIAEFIRYNFSENSDFKLAEMSLSYLERSVSIKDRMTGETMKLFQTYIDQSSPQGDSLSPPWWRLTDQVFSKLYTNSLHDLVEFNKEIYSFKHVAFSDDHLTIIALKIRIGTRPEVVKKILSKIGATCRNMLKSATESIGCGVNEAKSEIIVMEKFADPKIKGIEQILKSNFIWLGQSLLLSNDKLLKFTEIRLENRLEKMRREFSKVFLAVDNVSTRRLFYQTYVKPVIDYFLPVAMLQNTGHYCKMLALERFQHRTLAAVIGITKNVDRYELMNICQETTIQTKLFLLSEQLLPLFHRNSEEVADVVEVPIVMTTRSGFATCPQNNTWKASKNKDFGDKVNHLANIQRTKQYTAKKYGDFDPLKATQWRVTKNGQIQWRIHERLSSYFTN